MSKTADGWFRVYRSLFDSDIFNNDEPFTFRDFWIYLIGNANYVKGNAFNSIPCARGQMITSLQKLEEKCRWRHQKVVDRLGILVGQNMIRVERIGKAIRITIVNYEKYQNGERVPVGTDSGTQQGTDSGTQQGTDSGTQQGTDSGTQYKKDKEYKKNDKERKRSTLPENPDLSEVLEAFSEISTDFSPFQAEKIADDLEAYGKDKLLQAISYAVSVNKRSLGFVEYVLRNGIEVRKKHERTTDIQPDIRSDEDKAWFEALARQERNQRMPWDEEE